MTISNPVFTTPVEEPESLQRLPLLFSDLSASLDRTLGAMDRCGELSAELRLSAVLAINALRVSMGLHELIFLQKSILQGCLSHVPPTQGDTELGLRAMRLTLDGNLDLETDAESCERIERAATKLESVLREILREVDPESCPRCQSTMTQCPPSTCDEEAGYVDEGFLMACSCGHTEEMEVAS